MHIILDYAFNVLIFFLSINSYKNINQDEFVIVHDVITLIHNHWL